MWGLGLGVLGLGILGAGVAAARAAGDVKEAANTASTAQPSVNVYHSFGISPQAKAEQKAERDKRHKGQKTKLPKVDFQGVMQGVSTLADALSGPPPGTATPATPAAPGTPAATPAPAAAAPTTGDVEVGRHRHRHHRHPHRPPTPTGTTDDALPADTTVTDAVAVEGIEIGRRPHPHRPHPHHRRPHRAPPADASATVDETTDATTTDTTDDAALTVSPSVSGVPDERARISASILYLRRHHVRPWSKLPGGGTVITWSEVNKYGLASRKEIREQESFVDRSRTGAGKALDDFGEWLTIQDETVANMRDWLFWYVPDWKKVARGDARRSSGAQLIALGQTAEVRDAVIESLQQLGVGDPWAPDRAAAWSTVVMVAGMVAAVVVSVVATPAAGSAVGAGTMAAAALIAKSGDGVSLEELNTAVGQGAAAARSGVAAGSSTAPAAATPAVGAVPGRAVGARALRAFLKSGVAEPLAHAVHNQGFVGVLCDAATQPAILRAAGDAAKREGAKGYGVVEVNEGLFVWFGPRCINAVEGYNLLVHARPVTVGATEKVDPHYMVAWVRNRARREGAPTSSIGILPRAAGVVVCLDAARNADAAGTRLAELVSAAGDHFGIAAGVSTTVRPGCFLVWASERALGDSELCQLHDALVA